MRLLLFLDSRYKLAGMTYEKQVVDMILPDFVPEGPPCARNPPVIPEGFYRVSRKHSGFKRRGFPMTNVGNDIRKTVADVILPNFVPEGPPVIPEGFYRVSRKNSEFKRRGFPLQTCGNDIVEQGVRNRSGSSFHTGRVRRGTTPFLPLSWGVLFVSSLLTMASRSTRTKFGITDFVARIGPTFQL